MIVRRGQVGRAAQQPRHPLGRLVEHLARRRAGWQCPWHRPENGACRRPSPAGNSPRARSPPAARPSRDSLLAILLEQFPPAAWSLAAASADPVAKMRPALHPAPGTARLRANRRPLLVRLDFLFAQRRAVALVGVLACAASPRPMMACDDDQRRPDRSVARNDLSAGPQGAFRSLASATCTTCQPSPANRVPTSSLKASSVCPSIVMLLSS